MSFFMFFSRFLRSLDQSTGMNSPSSHQFRSNDSINGVFAANDRTFGGAQKKETTTNTTVIYSMRIYNYYFFYNYY